MDLNPTLLESLDSSLAPDALFQKLSEISGILTNLGYLETQTDRKKLMHLIKETAGVLEKDNEEVLALAVCCAVDLLRIYAPDAPFSTPQIQRLFSVIRKLSPCLVNPQTPKGVSFAYVLKVIAETSAIALLSKQGKTDLAGGLIEDLLGSVSKEAGDDVFRAIEAIVITAVEEATAPAKELLYPLLVSLTAYHRDSLRFEIVRRALRKVSSKVILSLDEVVGKAFEGGKCKCEELRGNERFGIVYNLYQIHKDAVLQVLLRLPQDFESKDKLRSRKSLELAGKLAACKGSNLAEIQQYLFTQFLTKFESMDKEIRCLMMELALRFFRHWNPGTDQVLSAVESRISDVHEKVRILAIQCLVAAARKGHVSPTSISVVCDRLRDKSEEVRQEARTGLMRLYGEGRLEAQMRDAEPLIESAFLATSLISSYRQVQVAVDQQHLLQLFDDLLLTDRTREDAAQALFYLFSDLLPDAKSDFSLILAAKNYWMTKLIELFALETDDLEAQEPFFSAHLQESYSILQMKANLEPKHSPVVLSLLKDKEMGRRFLIIADTQTEYAAKLRACEEIREIAGKRDSITAKTVAELICRTCNLWVSFDQISTFCSQKTPAYSLLVHISRVHPTFLAGLAETFIEELSAGDSPAELWNLLRLSSKQKKLKTTQLTKVKKCFPAYLSLEDEETAVQMGLFVSENMTEDYLRETICEEMVPKLSQTASQTGVLHSHLLILLQIMKTAPDAMASTELPLLKFVSNDLQLLKTPHIAKKDLPKVSILGRCKILGLELLAQFARNRLRYSASFNAKRVFRILFKIAFRLEKYIKTISPEGETVSIVTCYSKLEEQKLRSKSFGELLSLLSLKEVRDLLTPRRMVAISLLLLTPDQILREKISKFLLSDSEVRSRILPFSVSLMCILVASAGKQATSIRPTLNQAMRELANLAVSSTGETHPAEVYIVYMICICVSHPVYNDPGLIKRCILEYLQALPGPVNAIYLLSLCEHLPKVELRDPRPVLTDILLPQTKETVPISISEIAQLLDECVREMNPGEVETRRDKKIRIPAHFFKVKAGMESAKKFIESSAVSKREREGDQGLPVKRLSLKSDTSRKTGF